MIIRKLELYKFKRFFLSQVDRFVLEPKSNIMIMAWGNGKGKSSLLSVLNPLPAELKRDFKEDGYKYIEILHRGHEYKISSGMIEKNKHSFVYDDKELNQGGTKKVQLELVYEHFNLTPNVNQVVLGVDRFTAMSPSTRKEWFSKLSTIDYTFPIKVYNNLKARHRDIVSGIKLAQDNIVKLSSSVVSEEDLAEIKMQRSKLEEYITHIVSLYDHQDHNIKIQPKEELARLNNEVKSLLASSLPSLEPDYYLGLVNVIGNKISTLENDIKTINDRLVLLENDNGTYGTDIEKINNLRREKIIKICSLRKNKPINVDLNKIKEIARTYHSIYQTLISVAHELLDIERIEVTLEKLNTTRDVITGYSNRILGLEKKLTMLQGAYDGLEKYNKDEDLATCPTCNSTFHVHYNENESKLLLTSITKTQADIEVLKKNMELENVKYNLMLSIKETITKLKFIVSQYDVLKPIAEVFDSEIDFNTSYQSIISIIDSTKMSLDNLLVYSDEVKALKEINLARLRILALNDIKRQMHLDNIALLEKELETKTIELNTLRNDHKVALENKAKVMRIKDLAARIKDILYSYKKARSHIYTVMRNKHLSDLVADLKALLVDYDQKLLQNEQSRAKIEMCNKTIEDYKNTEAVLSKMLSALSPTDGIIAKSINSFLNIYIKEMNYIINSVWSYEMVLLPCDITDDNDLDYKFKVKVNNDEVIEDVSKLSSSMQEIVDLAYKIVFMKYMHISDTPLILDEFGRTMDETHRDTAYNIIDRIFTTNFEQIFLVSHFESMYGRFVNADMVQLEDVS